MLAMCLSFSSFVAKSVCMYLRLIILNRSQPEDVIVKSSQNYDNLNKIMTTTFTLFHLSLTQEKI